MATAASLLLLACSDQSLISPTIAPSKTRSLPPTADSRAGERALRQLAERVPSFGGLFLNEHGELVVYVTDRHQSSSVRAALVPFLQELALERGNPGARIPSIVVETGTYRFAELSEWRDRVEAHVFASASVVMIDLDERRNRIVVGLTDDTGRRYVEAALESLGVPGGMVELTLVTNSELQSAASGNTCGTLRDICRPIIGGTQITFLQDGTETTCTLGFPVLWGSRTGFVTNSHCTDDSWSPDYTSYWQPRSLSSIVVGTEAVDPHGWSCEITFKCRYSDAALVEAIEGVDVGFVARTSGVGNGSLAVSATHPRFAISSTSTVYGGETLYMMGRTSGWLQGTVTHTCVSFKYTWDGRWHKVLCSYVSNYPSQNGDSGGPVFLWNGSSDNITLLGVHFARNPIENHAFFSPMTGIRTDLGSMEVRAPSFRYSGGGGSGGGGCIVNDDPWAIIEPC